MRWIRWHARADFDTVLAEHFALCATRIRIAADNSRSGAGCLQTVVGGSGGSAACLLRSDARRLQHLTRICCVASARNDLRQLALERREAHLKNVANTLNARQRLRGLLVRLLLSGLLVLVGLLRCLLLLVVVGGGGRRSNLSCCHRGLLLICVCWWAGWHKSVRTGCRDLRAPTKRPLPRDGRKERRIGAKARTVLQNNPKWIAWL